MTSSSAEQTGKARHALELHGRIIAQPLGYDHAWWERVQRDLVVGDVPAVRTSLTAVLDITREAEPRR